MEAETHRAARMAEGLSTDASPWAASKRGNTVSAQALTAKRARILSGSMKSASMLDAGLGGSRAPPMLIPAPKPASDTRAKPAEERTVDHQTARTQKNARRKVLRQAAPNLINVDDRADKEKSRRNRKWLSDETWRTK